MSFERLRGFIDISRPHGTPTVTGFFLLGILSGQETISIGAFVIVVIISFFFRTSGALHNEMSHLDADLYDPTLTQKPIHTGLITKREGWAYTISCFVLGLVLSGVFFPILVTAMIVLALGMIFYYNAKGKFQPLAFELLYPISMALLVFAGAYLANGITVLTILLAFIVYSASLLTQWLHSLRDWKCDREENVGSLVVLASFQPDDARKKRNLAIVFGYIVWAIYTISLIIPFAYSLVEMVYLPVVLVIHFPVSYLVFKWLLEADSRRGFNKPLIFFVIAFWFDIPLFLLAWRGVSSALGLVGFVVIGTIVAILVQRSSQYKMALNRANSTKEVV